MNHRSQPAPQQRRQAGQLAAMLTVHTASTSERRANSAESSAGAQPVSGQRGLFERRPLVIAEALCLIVVVAILDWRVSDTVPLGWVYLVPMVVAARVLNRIPLLCMAAVCTVLAEQFDGYVWNWLSGLPRDVLYFSAFAGAGMFVHSVVRARQAAARHLHALETTIDARRDAEEQLQVLVDYSPVAVFTADAHGAILQANEAAERLFAVDTGRLAGQPFALFLPPLLDLPTATQDGAMFRTAMQCRGRRANGEIFQAEVWFSTYTTSTGERLAVFVADSSEDLRDREEANLQQLLTGSRILVGAVSHEVRNVCAAIAVVHENLRRDPALTASKDFEALGTLVLALKRIASVELSGATHQRAAVELRSLLEEFQIVIAPSMREQEIELHWSVPSYLPPVWADRQSLVQVLLNLVKNSERALDPLQTPPVDGRARSIGLSAVVAHHRVEVAIADTGPGVAHPEFLFKPFQQQAQSAGLGLYLSRAMMRSFSGDLRYESSAAGQGAVFVVDLALAPEPGVRSGT